jgi:hypothetical protein
MPAAQSNTSGYSGQSASPYAANMAARRLILRGGPVQGQYVPPAIDVIQPLNPQLQSGIGLGSVLTFQLRNVGLVKRLILRITATVTAGANSTQTLTKIGLPNLVSNVTFLDLGSNTRINTTGWHLNLVASAKRRRVYGAAYTTDTPSGFGDNNNRCMYAPATIDATDNSEIDLELEIPFVKNDIDLRGAIYADVTSANMFCQVTLNPNAFVSSTADPTAAVYQSAGADLATISDINTQLFQNYLDQLPRVGGVPILPQLDIATAYLLNATSSGLPVQNQDNGNAFVNNRAYESVAFVYDNNGTLNVNGSDLNNISLQSANFTNIINVDGRMAALMMRNIMLADPPAGMYYFDFRHRPIDTNQYGNMQLIINPSNVGGSGAYFWFGWEAFGIIGLVNQGGSLPMA